MDGSASYGRGKGLMAAPPPRGGGGGKGLMLGKRPALESDDDDDVSIAESLAESDASGFKTITGNKQWERQMQISAELLRGKGAATAPERVQVADLNRKLTTSNSRNTRLQADLATAQTKIRTLTGRVKTLELEKSAEITRHQREVSAIQRSQKKDAQVLMTPGRVTRNARLNSDGEGYIDTTAISDENVQLKHENAQLKAQLSAAQNSINLLTQARDALITECNGLRASMDRTGGGYARTLETQALVAQPVAGLSSAMNLLAAINTTTTTTTNMIVSRPAGSVCRSSAGNDLNLDGLSGVYRFHSAASVISGGIDLNFPSNDTASATSILNSFGVGRAPPPPPPPQSSQTRSSTGSVMGRGGAGVAKSTASILGCIRENPVDEQKHPMSPHR